MGSCQINTIILHYNGDSADCKGEEYYCAPSETGKVKVTLTTQPDMPVSFSHPQVTASLAKYNAPSLLNSDWGDICEYVDALEGAKKRSAEGLVSETREFIGKASLYAHRLGFGLKPDSLGLLKNAIRIHAGNSRALSCWQNKVDVFEREHEYFEMGLKYFLTNVTWITQCKAQKGTGELEEEIGKHLEDILNRQMVTTTYDRGDSDSIRDLAKNKNTLDRVTGILFNYQVRYKNLNHALIEQYQNLAELLLDFAAVPDQKGADEAIRIAADCENKINALEKF